VPQQYSPELCRFRRNKRTTGLRSTADLWNHPHSSRCTYAACAIGEANSCPEDSEPLCSSAIRMLAAPARRATAAEPHPPSAWLSHRPGGRLRPSASPAGPTSTPARLRPRGWGAGRESGRVAGSAHRSGWPARRFDAPVRPTAPARSSAAVPGDRPRPRPARGPSSFPAGECPSAATPPPAAEARRPSRGSADHSRPAAPTDRRSSAAASGSARRPL
jgi:hypothetical protein